MDSRTIGMSVRSFLSAIAGFLLLFGLSTGPAASQFLPGFFETPEQELEALLRMLGPDRSPEVIALTAAMLAPAVIFPEAEPDDGLEWAHFWGGRVDDASADFAWGTVSWTIEGETSLRVVAHIAVADRSLSGRLVISKANIGGPEGLTIQLELGAPWADPQIDPRFDIRVSSRLAINQAEIAGLRAGDNGVTIGAADALAIASFSALGVSATYADGRTLVIMLSLGETGRTILAQAFAAWGFGPTP